MVQSPIDTLTVPANRAPNLTLVKTATLNDDDGTPGLSAGDTISYAFTVTNTGNVTLTGIAVTDPDATITGSPILTLAPGATDTSVTGVHILTQAEIDSGAFANSADATGQDPAGTDVSDTSGTDATNDTPTEVTLSPAGSLTLVKTATLNDDDGTPGLSAGDTISYAFTVTNTGNVTLTGIAVTDPDATITGSPILTLAPGASDTSVTGVHILTQAEIDSGAFANSADATGQDPAGTDVSDTSGTDATNDTPTEVTLSPAGSLTLVKTATLNDDDGTPGLSAGDTISYAFTVTNTGNVTLTGIAVTDPDATITGSPILTLAPGATDTSVTGVHILTQAEIDSGAFANSADATGQDPAGSDVSDTSGTDATNDTPTEVTLSPAGSLTLVKTATLNDDDGTPGLSAGDTISYAFTVTNTGNVTLTGIAVTDPDATITGSPILTLAPGATDTSVTGVHILTQPEIDSGAFANSADATGQDPAGTDVSDTSGTDATNDTPTSVTLSPAGSLTLVKTATLNDDDGTPGLSAGDTISYAFTVTNTGNVSGSLTLVKTATLNDDDGTPGLSAGDTISYAFTVTNTGNVTLTRHRGDRPGCDDHRQPDPDPGARRDRYQRDRGAHPDPGRDRQRRLRQLGRCHRPGPGRQRCLRHLRHRRHQRHADLGDAEPGGQPDPGQDRDAERR